MDDPTGISEFPHLIVNQARVLDYFAEFMANSPTRMAPDYGFEFRGLEVTGEGEYPVDGDAASTPPARDEGQERTVRAKYVVGARRRPQRGARGDRLHASPATRRTTPGASWTCSPSPTSPTSAPSARSSPERRGSILLIPREGGYLFRMYVDLGEVRPDDNGAVRSTTIEQIIAKANEILHPYTLDVQQRRLAQRLRGRPPRSPTGSTTSCRRSAAPARRASSSPATPATRTAPRPARA